jgi:chemotaxis protein CheD
MGNRPFTLIHPGEFLATADDIVIATVLGSCVAVALRDTERAFGGLNHFMLPGSFDRSDRFGSRSAKYGMHAMELLINDLMKLGARRDRLTAKVFGGASMLGSGADRLNKVPRSNIEFAFEYLATEGIPVVASDVGGTAARKILFYVRDGRVLLKRISGNLTAAIKLEESGYRSRIAERGGADDSAVTLFCDQAE